MIDAIESALNQTYPNISITLVDDCSKDDSVKTVYNKYFKKNPHETFSDANGVKKVVAVPNRAGQLIELTMIQLTTNVGPAEARNVGMVDAINEAAAFAILDADDMMHPNKVMRLATEMFSIPEFIGAVYADYDVLNIVTGTQVREHKESFDSRKLASRCIVHSGSLVSSKALNDVKDEHGFYDKRIKGPEDWDLWLRIANKYTIVHVPEVLTIVRATGQNISSPSHSEFNENYSNGYRLLREKHGNRAN